MTTNEAVTLHSAALPDLICTATTAIASGQTIATLPLGHPWLRLVAPPKLHSVGLCPNACLIPLPQDSSDTLCKVVSTQPIGLNEMILVRAEEETCQPSIQIVGQFDGSCLREEGLGGAGYVIYVIEGGHSRVLACRAVCLPKCSDNIEAEILACQFVVEEISTLVKQLLTQRGISFKKISYL